VLVLMVRSADIRQFPALGLEPGDDVATRHAPHDTHHTHPVKPRIQD
jgi:hypothetical protein